MPEYLSPGVYIEEVETGSRPIEGASTSTAGMVGVTEWGPDKGLPVLVTSFAEYQRKFGGFLDEQAGEFRYLPFAVQGFFQNGGQRLYIKRVTGEGAEASNLPLLNGVATRLSEDMCDTTPGLKHAKLVSLRGIYTGLQIRLEERDSNGNTFIIDTSVAAYNEKNKEITFWDTSTQHKFSSAGTIVKAGAAVLDCISVSACSAGKWGDKIFVNIEPASKTSSVMYVNESLAVRKAVNPIDDLKLADKITAKDTKINLEDAVKVRVGDEIQVGDEKKLVQEVNENEVVVDSAFNNAYDTAASIKDLTVIRPVNLEFAENPAKGANSLKLAEVSKLKKDDAIIVRNSAGMTETVKITAIDAAASTVTIDKALSNDYSLGTGSIFLSTVFNCDISVDNTAGLSVNDRVAVCDKVLNISDRAEIKKIKGNVITLGFDPLKGVSNTYASGTVLELKKAARPGETALTPATTNNFYAGAVVELDNGIQKEYRVIEKIDESKGSIILDNPVSNMYINGDSIRTCEYKMSFNHVPQKDAVAGEVYEYLSMNKDAQNYFSKVINDSSKLVSVIDKTPNNKFKNPITREDTLACPLGGGKNGVVNYECFKGGGNETPGNRSGINALVDIEDISIAAVPGITDKGVQGALINHCELTMKNRFAVIEASQGLDIEGVLKYREHFNSSYAAMYYPWLNTYDPATQKNIDIPPSGHMIGIYARSDEKRGVHKAPANEGINGITGIELQISKNEQDVLNPKGINAVRMFPNSGILVWGARTLSDNSLWKYINVRRLFIYLEESIKDNTQWVVFEPNNEKLWARVILSISEFLTRVWRDGALMGTRVEEAFYVKCDKTTMTQSDIDNGRLIVEIGVAPVKPAEFVIFRISQWSGNTK